MVRIRLWTPGGLEIDGITPGEFLYALIQGNLEDKHYGESFKELLEHVDNLEFEHPHDALTSIIWTDVSIELDFAKNLNLFDSVASGCLSSKSERGIAIINLFSICDLTVVLLSKRWDSSNELSLDFALSDEDCIELKMDLMSCNIFRNIDISYKERLKLLVEHFTLKNQIK